MKKPRWLTVYFYVFGAANLLTSVLVPLFFGEHLLWEPRNLPTDLMVGSLYLAMGMIMLGIARAPQKHKAFVDFVIVANILHALVMAIFAQKPNHLYLDVAFAGLMGFIPLALYPWPMIRFLQYSESDIWSQNNHNPGER